LFLQIQITQLQAVDARNPETERLHVTVRVLSEASEFDSNAPKSPLGTATTNMVSHTWRFSTIPAQSLLEIASNSFPPFLRNLTCAQLAKLHPQAINEAFGEADVERIKQGKVVWQMKDKLEMPLDWHLKAYSVLTTTTAEAKEKAKCIVQYAAQNRKLEEKWKEVIIKAM